MAIHEVEEREGSAGIEKQIEKSAMSMIFDNVQKNQYTEPEKSTIRELFSNGADAVNEKLAALDIIHGRKKVEDVYVVREGEIYADSMYMPEYYDEKWLDPNKNNVIITHTYALPGLGKDVLTIEDFGVGIGNIVNPKTNQSRLKGVLKLAYSTKRLNTKQLGKFGIGAKAALSTGTDSYTMITRHNGKEYRFEVYDYKAESIVPKFNMETGEANPTFLLDEGTEDEYLGYYLPTTEKNGTIIRVETSRFARKFYENGVKSQLLYFNNVKFKIIDEDGDEEEVPVQAEIQYEDDFIILANNTQFSKPHFVLNGINYGYINYERLELNEKLGSVAYKIRPESVTVHPSRESLIWDAKTRDTALEMEKIVAGIATRLVMEQMQETDLIRWIRKGTQALGENRDKNSIIGKLLDQVDKTDLVAIFTPEPEIKYNKDPERFFYGMEMILVTMKSVKNKDGEGYVNRVHREVVKTWAGINYPLYLQTERTLNKREAHMLNLHPDGFVKMKMRDLDASFMEAGEMDPDAMKEWQKLKNDENHRAAFLAKQQIFLKYLMESEETTLYESVEYPKDSKVKEEEEESQEKETIVKGMTPAQLREVQGKTVCMYPYFSSWRGYEDRDFVWAKDEPVIKNIINDNADIIYGFKEDEELIHLVAQLLTERDNGNQYEFYNREFKLIRIAQSAAKHFKGHTYIKDFILSVNPETKSIAMHSKLVNWHTGRKINEAIERMKFLENFGRFNPEIQETYKSLKTFRDEHFKEVQGSSKFGCSEEMLQDLNTYANKVIDLQMYIEQNQGNIPAIAAHARTLFEIPEDEEGFEEAIGVNMPVYRELQKALDYIKPLEFIFNYISPLVEVGGRISNELEIEIREIMHNKGMI